MNEYLTKETLELESRSFIESNCESVDWVNVWW